MTDDKKKFQAEWDKILTPVTPTRPASPAPVGGVFSEPDLENILRQAGWPEEHVPYMAKMAGKESSGVASATRIRKAGQGQKLPETSYGLWQVNTLAHPQYDPGKLSTDPVYNAKAALEIFKKQGFDAWLNSKKKLAAEGIFPGQVRAAAPAVDVNSLFPNAGGFQAATPQGVDVNSLFPNADGFQKIPQTPTDVGIPAYTAHAQTDATVKPSIPSERPVLKPRDNKAVTPVKAQPTNAVGSDPIVGEAEEDYGTVVDQGVYVQDHRKIGRVGERSGNILKTVTVDYTPERKDRQATARVAAEQVASENNLTAQQVTSLATRLAQKPLLVKGTGAGDQYDISEEDIAAVKGSTSEYLTDRSTADTQLNRDFQEVSLDSLFTKEEADQFNAANNNIFNTQAVGFEDEQNLALGAIRSGGAVWRSLAGLYRAANELWTQPFGDGTNRHINPQKPEDIKAYRGDDIYKYMTSIADNAEGLASEAAKRGGTRAEVFQFAGALPGDFSRVMLMSRLPGGIVSGMSADMASQSLGRGESLDQAGREAFKGALFGAIAKYATPVGEKIKEVTGSRLAGGVGALGFTGAATYPVSRAFGASEKDALKETIFNTVFALGDAAPVLAGRTIRARDAVGNEVAVKVEPTGEVTEVQLPKEQPADVELYDPYMKQALTATDRLTEQMQRPTGERLKEATLKVESPDVIVANPQATSILNDVVMRAVEGKDFNGFHGLAMDHQYVGYFTKHLEDLLANAKGHPDAPALANFINQFKEVTKQVGGRAAYYTKYDGLDAVNAGTRAEELVHMKNDMMGVQEVSGELAELPGIKRVLDNLDKSYEVRDLKYRVDEAIAQSFRPHAESHLGLTRAELNAAQIELFRALKGVEGFDVHRYTDSLRGISRRGDVLARYARQQKGRELRGQHGIEDVRGGADQVNPNVRGVQPARGEGLGDSSGNTQRDTGGQPERGRLQGRASQTPQFAAAVDEAELRRRATKAIAEIEALRDGTDMPTKEKIAAILGKEDHSFGRSPSAALYALNEALEEGGEFPLGEGRSWADQPVPVPETAVKAGSEARNQEIFDQVTAAPKKKGKYVPNPDAVERGSILEDGKIWVQGKQVPPTDENVAIVRAMAEHNKSLIDERLQQLDNLKNRGSVTPEQIGEIVGKDHRFGSDVDAAIRDLESAILDNGMYLQDITEANAAYKASAPAPKLKAPKAPAAPKVPKTGESKGAIVGDTPVPSYSANPFKQRAQESGFQEYVPTTKREVRDPRVEDWRQRQEQTVQDTPERQRLVGEKVDGEVRQAYKDNGGDQLKAVEDTLAGYEKVIAESQDPNVVTFYKSKLATLRQKYRAVIGAGARQRGGDFNPQFAHLWHGSRHLFKPEVLVEGPDGQRQYIEGEQKKFPVGTRVSRRGENIIVKSGESVERGGIGPQRELHSVDSWLPQIPEGYKVIEKFPLGRIRDDKINTGEGAQIRGYGHYKAEARGVAKSYKRAGARSDGHSLSYKGNVIPDTIRSGASAEENALFDLAIQVEGQLNNGKPVDLQKAIDFVIEDSQKSIDWWSRESTSLVEEDITTKADIQENIEFFQDLAEAARNFDPADFQVQEPSRGYLYRVKTNVKDSDLLHLDKQIKDQGEHIQDIAREFDNSRGYDFYDADNPSANDPVSRTGEQLYKRMSREFDRTTPLGVLSKTGGGDVLASEFLRDKGIKGLKFLDQDSRYKDRDILWKGQSLRSHYGKTFQYGEPGYHVLPDIEEFIEDGHSPATAIELTRTRIADQIDFLNKNYADTEFRQKELKDREARLQTLGTLFQAKDFTQNSPENLTHNHVIFKGEDVDVRRIQFAQALKDNRVFDKKAVDEVSAFTDENFPQLASLWKPRKSTGTPLATNPNPVAAERMANARGLEAEGKIEKIADRVVGIYREFKRQFKEIDPNESVQMARTADSFRLLTNLNNWAKVQAANDVARITEGLTREQYDVFENVLVLRDKQQAVEQGMKPGHGYADLADVEKSLKEFERAAKADPVISKALADREALRKKVVGELVGLDMLGPKSLENDRYYHRQVPGVATDLFLSMGHQDVRVKKKGFEKQRTGEGDNYNTNYVESEIEWLSQANAQIRRSELLKEIQRAVDISNDLKVEAKILGVDWHTLIDKGTHRTWQPKEGSYFYRTMSAPDQLITDIFSGQHTQATAQAELKAVMARGQKKPEWVLPLGVAKLMDDFEVQPHEGALKQTTANAMATWKQWMLINPKNFLSYNIRNFISDLDAAMAYPGVIKELPQAIKDIYGYSRSKNHPAAAEIEQAIKDGVMDSGQTFAEIPDISKLGAFKIFADSDTNVLSRGMNKVWEAMKNSSNARENWIRLAAYRHIKQKIEAGEPVYGASNRFQVDALSATPGRQAAKLARELVGDYGGISEAGRAVRKHAMPFYSWMEINAPRYVRMIKNMPHEGVGSGARVLTGRAVIGGAKTAAKLTAITLGINAWNHLMFPDLEDQLAKTDVGKRPHLIVGTNPDGTARVFQADTALRDALDWFDLGDVYSDYLQVADGRATVWDKVGEAVKAPINRGVQALGPIKTGAELLFGESSFPNIFEKGWETGINTRPIRDRAEHLAQALAVKGVYQWVMDRPMPPSSGPIGQLSDWFLTQRIDPEESIFWNVRGRVSDYKKKMGKSTGGTDPTEKSNTLFRYKQAIRWNNPMLAEKYLNEYKEEFGGTDAGLKQSLDRTHPLGSLAKADWPEFIRQLTPDERDQLKVAIQYYDETFKKGPHGTPAVDTSVDELLEMTFPGMGTENIDRMVEKSRHTEDRKELREQRKKARGLQ